MRVGGGKQKGSQFERDICEKLSRWVEPSTDRSLFWRSAMSGGRATIRRQQSKSTGDQAGDICSIAPEGHALMYKFVVECKHVKTLHLTSGIVHGKQELALFWAQVCRDAAVAGKRPLLIAKQNSVPILAFIRTADYPNYFGPISVHERARLFTLGRPSAPSVSMFLLEQLLRCPYVDSRFRTL